MCEHAYFGAKTGVVRGAKIYREMFTKMRKMSLLEVLAVGGAGGRRDVRYKCMKNSGLGLKQPETN